MRTETNDRTQMANNNGNGKSLESWIWDAACSIRGAKDAPKYKDFILPLIFTKRLCDVFDDEVNRIAGEVGSPKKAFHLVKADHKELAKNDCNISLSRYIHTSDAETYRPIAEIVEELNAIELTARETDEALRGILKQLGFGA
jgi:type I restriction-modification system DNA methylase subunit